MLLLGRSHYKDGCISHLVQKQVDVSHSKLCYCPAWFPFQSTRMNGSFLYTNGRSYEVGFYVKCDEEKNVREIVWDGCHLWGSPSWKDLPNTLIHLDLSCHTSCGYPGLNSTVKLQDLPRSLKYIDLSFNKFYGSLDLSTLPPQLENAFFNSNEFSGSLDLTHLPFSLVFLSLYNNKFAGPIDLTKIPKNLKSLYLNHNQLSGEISLDELPHGLKNLYFLKNHLTGVVDVRCLLSSTEQRTDPNIHLEWNHFSAHIPVKLPKNIVYGNQADPT